MILKEMLNRLNQPIPSSLISSKKVGGNSIDYIAWYDYCDLLDERVGVGNWQWEIIEINCTESRIFLSGKLTIIAEDKSIFQMATGTEILNCSSYGDPSSNAEAMALRRCCAKFGLARDLWKKEDKKANYSHQEKTPEPYKSNKEISRVC